MSLANALAPVRHLVKALQEAGHLLGLRHADRRGCFFIPCQVGRQLLGSQPAPSPAIEFFDPEFLGPVVPLVEILSHPLETGSVAQGLPARSLVSGSLEILPVDKALDQDNGVVVVLLPILREALETPAHRSGSQIGKLLAWGQNDEATVLGQKMQSSFPLALRPS